MNLNENHIAWMKFHCPFYDSYTLINSKDKNKAHDCVIDRRFTKLSYQVFSMILEASTPETLEENLRNPEKYIKRARNIRRKRVIEYNPEEGKLKTKILHSHVDENYRTEGMALEQEGPQAIKASIDDAREIIFDADYDELPLYANAGWQFLIDMKYNFEKIGTKPEEKPIAKFPDKIDNLKKKVSNTIRKDNV